MANQAQKKNLKNYKAQFPIYQALIMGSLVVKLIALGLSFIWGTFSLWDLFLFASKVVS